MSVTAQSPKVVVYGDYPPYVTPAAAATLATVRSLLDEGREIEVVSPRPSAAHHHADVGNPNGAAKLAWLSRGAELVVHVNAGILGPARRPGSPIPVAPGPATARAGLALAVRRARSATVHLTPLTPHPSPRWTQAILGPAERIVVASQEDADRLRSAGISASKLSVAEEAWWLPGARAAGPALRVAVPSGEPATAWEFEPGASREAVEAEVRRRAAANRSNEAANPVSASWPLHMLHPLSPAPTGAPNALFRLVKRVVHRLVAWEVVPIVEQVNHLQRATIESLDRHAKEASAQRRAPETSS